VEIRELAVGGSFEVTPRLIRDDRGLFLESFRHDELQAALGHPFALAQGNTSVSHRGVVRGIHYADVPPGQAKYVTCAFGAVVDFVIDIRVGSPTYGVWDSVVLDDRDRRAIYLSEGLGHMFVSLTDGATVTYMVSSVFDASREHGVNPLDPEIGLRFPEEAGELRLSPKDLQAPSLAEARQTGMLPQYDELLAFDAARRTK
jgi:dTDP-4-dehydrorhamnose 3,5-epimerase